MGLIRLRRQSDCSYRKHVKVSLFSHCQYNRRGAKVFIHLPQVQHSSMSLTNSFEMGIIPIANAMILLDVQILLILVTTSCIYFVAAISSSVFTTAFHDTQSVGYASTLKWNYKSAHLLIRRSDNDKKVESNGSTSTSKSSHQKDGKDHSLSASAPHRPLERQPNIKDLLNEEVWKEVDKHDIFKNKDPEKKD